MSDQRRIAQVREGVSALGDVMRMAGEDPNARGWG